MNRDDVIKRLGLTPLGFEGGFYRETFRQATSTAIFYMLTPHTSSLMHRLRGPEVYHFYLGDPVEMLMLHGDGTDIVTLGQDLAAGQRVQHVVPGGVWQGSRLVDGGAFALMGTTMSPGFDLADFTLGDRDELTSAYPDHAARIRALTPELVKTEHLDLAAAGLDLLHAARRGAAVIGAGLRATVDDTLAAFVTNDAPIAPPSPRYETTWYFVARDDRRAIGAACVTSGPTIEVMFTEDALAPEAIRGLVQYLIAQCVERVAVVEPGNAQIRSALTALGFREDGPRLVLEPDQSVG